jgi:5'-phosphate synthase pdxT subunit
VLAIQGDYAAHAASFAAFGEETVLVKTPQELDRVTALVLPGGESTTMLRLLRRDGFDAVLHDFVRKHPVFATCAGCILLAREVCNPHQESFDALDIAIERNAYGRQNDSAILPVETTLAGGPMEAVFIRAPRILKTGPQVETLAKRDGFPVLVREGSILAATFHPELSEDRRVHQAFLEMLRKS